jgi:hypothetical protein
MARKVFRVLVLRTEGKRQCDRGREDNINMDVKEIGWVVVAQDRYEWHNGLLWLRIGTSGTMVCCGSG